MDGCCGYIKALSLASMLEKQGYKKILLLTGDLNSKMTEKSEIGTKILFGDGISLNILEKDRSTIDTQIFNSGDNNDMISCKIELCQLYRFPYWRLFQNSIRSLYLQHNQQHRSIFQNKDNLP